MSELYNFAFAALLLCMALGAWIERYSRTTSERETVPAGRATGGAPRVSRSELVSQECTTLHDYEECAWLECSCQCHLIEARTRLLADLQVLGYPESSNYQEES